MEVQTYLENMKSIQSIFIDYINNSENVEELYQNLSKSIDDEALRYNLKPILYLLLKISNNHHRSPTFFEKMENFTQFRRLHFQGQQEISSIFNQK